LDEGQPQVFPVALRVTNPGSRRSCSMDVQDVLRSVVALGAGRLRPCCGGFRLILVVAHKDVEDLADRSSKEGVW
jgi:hypothetical protein